MSEILQTIGWENRIEVWHLASLFILFGLIFFWDIGKQKPRKILRTIALLLAFISLYIIYLSPFILTKKPLKSVVLISEKIDENTIDSLNAAYDLILLQEVENSKFRQIGKEQISTLGHLNYQIDTAFVYGYFPQLNPIYYQFRKDIEIQKGIYIDYPKSVALGDSLSIVVQNLENKSVEVSTFIGNDSISKAISAKSQSRISVLPKSAGYILSEISTNTEDYHFAIKVEEKENYVIQILAATPDFEWKFFSDYLKSKEHSVHQKTQISKGKFKLSFFNWHDSLQMESGVANDLKILFSDAKAWDDLAQNAKDRYLQTLQENHGSLILRTNPNSQIQLNLDKSKPTNIFSTSDNLLETDSYNYLQFNNIYRLNEVAKNVVFRKVNREIIYGVINFQNSFELQLSGENEKYEQIWAPIFTDLVRKKSDIYYDMAKWSVQYQPFFFRLWSSEKVKDFTIFNLHQDTIRLKLKEDNIYPERQHFMFYPKTEGWHFILLKSPSEPIPFYVHKESFSSQSEFLSNYNYDYLNYLNFEFINIEKQKEQYNQESITLWFFVLFLFSLGYLWIEDKIT